MFKLIFSIFIMTLSFGISAQSYNNPGGTVNTCSGTFYDSGGSGSYTPNENIVTTFCSDNGGAIVIDFSNYDLYPDPSGAYLRVYDGPTNDPGTLIETLTGSDYSGSQIYISSGTCITFEFYSCGWCGYFPGWVASISCQAPATCIEGDCATCNELSFENTSVSDDEVCLEGWELLKGKNDVPGPYTVESPGSDFSNCRGTALASDIYHINNCATNIPIYDGSSSHHDIIDASSGIGSDYHQAVPAVPNLSGSNANVMRLGESAPKCFAGNAEGMTSTFTITDPFLAYHYLLKFENTGHDDNDRGFCTFEIRNDLGDVLPCGSFQVYEDGTTNAGENWVFDATYTNAQSSQNGIWYMTDWNTVIMDVSDYIGQELTIEVWVADCQLGAHGSWGYFDFECLTGVTPDCSVTPLPVEFNDLTYNCENEKGFLSWSTFSEKDNSHFTIRKSIGGKHFFTIGELEGNGTTTSSSSYEFEIERQGEATAYYQLLQTDFDGEETVLKTIAVENCSPSPVFVHCTNGIVDVSGDNIAEILITDAMGNIVKRTEGKENPQKLSIENQGEGVYFVTIVRYNDSPYVVRIIK